MRERVAFAGGTLTIVSDRRGTRLRADLPLAECDAAALPVRPSPC